MIQDADGRNRWRTITTRAAWAPAETALLICDMWDHHWSHGAELRVDRMAPRMNLVVKDLRGRGVSIIHAPSDTLDFYRDHPARQRAVQVPRAELPELLPHDEPSLPVDDSDGGSDTNEEGWWGAWTRQHEALEIHPDRDIISDDGQEIWSFLQHQGIRHLLLCGVHTNMCILGRPFGIKRMVRQGMDVALVRDLTDALYNPARSPYVSQAEGTRLVIEYIEKFWCPSVSSEEWRP